MPRLGVPSGEPARGLDAGVGQVREVDRHFERHVANDVVVADPEHLAQADRTDLGRSASSLQASAS